MTKISKINTNVLVSYHEGDRGVTHEFCLNICYCNIDEMISILQDAKKLLGPNMQGTANLSIDVGSKEKYDFFSGSAYRIYGW